MVKSLWLSWIGRPLDGTGEETKEPPEVRTFIEENTMPKKDKRQMLFCSTFQGQPQIAKEIAKQGNPVPGSGGTTSRKVKREKL